MRSTSTDSPRKPGRPTRGWSRRGESSPGSSTCQSARLSRNCPSTTRSSAPSALTRYVGYLKCYYTAGMIGGVAGYFAYPKGGFAGDVGEEMPHWLEQMTVLARVHALFSHLERFLRQGRLVPGPGKHKWSKDLPAYELPTGDPQVRVLAREHVEREQWLVCAWGSRRRLQRGVCGPTRARTGRHRRRAADTVTQCAARASASSAVIP